ncbi:MAG: 50S ribosomal protein L4 [Candidatus Moranbacteria bacterium]|nr:50S ribosomal protein L4 [Candidatus Moranbacteria bacterium]
MAKIEVKNLKGEKVEDLQLKDEIFGVERSDALIHQVYVSQASNRRSNTAHTKTRKERRGSGQKPWRQKGTGRARVGTVRNPIWRKGGVAFGPRNERNYNKKINKKMKRAAVKMVLSGKLADREIVVLKDNNFEENKTGKAKKALDNLKIKGTVLWAYGKEDNGKRLATRNLENVENILWSNLNVFDMLNKKYLIISKDDLQKLEELYKAEEAEKEPSKAEAETVSQKA